MKLSELKLILENTTDLAFRMEDGTAVPEHFHVTEVGAVTKHFIDCGGTVRNEYAVNFQLWHDNDTHHRLAPAKLLHIIALSEEKLGLIDGDIEVEYQAGTIGKYALEYNGTDLVLTSKKTACLAYEQCGIPPVKQKLKLSELKTQQSCTPGSGCC
jgi:hypothetical protein